MKFVFSFIVCKIVAFVFRITGRRKNDRPGLLAQKLCPDFKAHIRKPKLVIGVTGTNGKTSISYFVIDILKELGYSVAYNDWGSNITAGHSICLLNSVNIFNRPKYDAVVLELDEKSCEVTVPQVKPDYVIVTNLARDSIRRNAHIDYIYGKLDRAFDASPNTKLILNANDPISAFLGKNNERVYVDMSDMHMDPLENNAPDYIMCPKCMADAHYDYRLYRSIGRFSCPNCGMESPYAKYHIDKVDFDKNNMIIKEGKESCKYSLVNDTIFYAFNLAQTIALFREIGIPNEKLVDIIDRLEVTSNRSIDYEKDGKFLHVFASKGQNGSSCSTVFEYLVKDKADKELMIIMDEVLDSNHPVETLTWIYEADFEFLKSKNITKVIFGGKMIHQYKVRLQVAGVDMNKVCFCENELDVLKFLSPDCKNAYLLFDVDRRDDAMKILELYKKEDK